MNVMKFIRYDKCFNCNAERSIECYDSYNNPINYPVLVDKYLDNKEINIEKRSLSYMKCKKCNTEYKINWSRQDRFPIPLYDKFYIDLFNYKYNKPVE